MRARTLSRTLLVLTALAALPLVSDGGQAECCNATMSLTTTAVGPVNGDETFFKLPTGPANVMFLLDVSGSMNNFPACGDNAWDGGTTACTTPTIAAPSNPSSSGTGTPKIYYTVNGSCAPSTLTSPSGTSSPLYWMEQITPTTSLPDPGRSNALVTDKPSWGTGCTGNACLFEKDSYYFYGDWTTTATGASATRRESDTDATLPVGCTYINSSGTAVTDKGGNKIDLGSACRTCMTNRGFYFYSVKYYNASSQLKSDSGLLFKGTFLNAYPPKFVAAKKVIKDIAFMDPANPSKMDQVRLGLTVLNSNDTSPQKADLIVPLGPDKVSAFPPTQQGFAQARQYILSVLNYDKSVYKDSSGNVIVDGTTITGGFFDPANTSTPLGSALFNIGQYFSSLNRFNTLLGTGYQTSAFNESSPGLTNAAWARSNPNQCSVCWACQNNAVVIVTDGAPNSEITFPTAISGYDTSGYNGAANCGAAGGCASAVVPRVADWLHNIDLRDDAVMSGKQALAIHTIGLSIPKCLPGQTCPPSNNNPSWNVLNATANLGGGIFQTASDPTSLSNAVVNAINQVIPKENSFSAASATSLMTVETAAAQAFVTRFKPNQTPTWEGHVFEMFLFDEALNGCVPGAATQPTVQCFGKTVSADFNGDGLCNGLFQIDLDCDQVAEDPNTGDFVKKGQATPSNLPWDAGAVLSDSTKTGYKSADETAANARNIFTYVNGAKTAFTAANASTLLPLMNISSAWCSSFLTQIGVTAGSNPTLQCAQNLIYFVRGWDVLDQDTDGCKGPGQTNPSTCPSGIKGEERNRANDNNTTPFFWKLGDIFHSSPGVVLVPSDEIRCLTTYDKQCNATLFSPPGYPSGTQTAIVGYTDSNGNPVDAYAKYRLNNIHRQRVLLVGANDGMLHAFDAGAPDTTQPADITGEYPYTIGTGSELWAFLPPDMLPRLKDLIGAHQYMVDGSVMLRDVWVDGSGSQVSSKDFKKQSDEYHTVAIFGRRAGGAAYSALDVTNPTSPVLLWSFPQGCSDDARYMGESWAEFAPRPPPIFPVRLNNPSSPLKDSPSGTFYEERWVVMLNGGYDPMLAKGRAVFMLDAWTGTTLWRFTDADFKQQLGYGSGTSMFPVTSAIEGVDIGDPTKQSIDGDGFIDTATWADLGGQLWLARFYTPGVIDKATGRVNNWFAARAFEQQRRTDDLQYVAGRNEFFFMPDNIYDAASHTLHTYLGSGNREQIMGQAASCGTDNMLACCQGGCTNVTATTTDNYGACNLTTTFSCVNGAYSYATSTTASCGTTSTPSTTSETCAAAPGNAYTSSLNAHWVCPGAGTVADQPGSASCDGSGLCTITPMAQRNISGTYNAPSHNRFYGIWSFGGDPKKMFDTPSVPGSDTAAAALIFDQNRFTDVSYPAACGGPAGKSCTLVNTTTAKVTASASNSMLLTTSCGTGVTKCSATSTDPGWFYEYGDVCPLSGCTTSPPWTDEKTGSEATTLVGCVMWGSFRPVGATTSTSPCSGTLGVPAAYSYGAHYMAGTMNPNVCGLSTLAVASAITSPPNAAIPMIDVGGGGGQSGGSPPSGPPKPFGTTQTGCSGGSISYGAASFNPGSGSSKTIVHQSSCANEPVYWLEVPRDLHSCRHVAPAAGSSNCE